MIQKSFFKQLFFTGFFGVLFFIAASAAQAATLAVSPTSNSVALGGTFTVNIVLDTTGQAIAGADIYSLHFNPAVLQVVDADASTAGVQITAGSLMPNNQYNFVDNANGVIQFSQTPAAGGTNFTGTGNLASITFSAIGAGTSNLNFDFTPGSTIDTNVAVLYSDALTAVTNGSYTVTNTADVTAPTVPTGLSASSTSSTAILVSWTASTDPVVAGKTTSGVSGYQVFRCQGSGCTPSVQIATSTLTSFSSTGLLATTAYGFSVKAYDAAGNISGFSSNAAATTPAAPDLTAPVISTVSADSVTQSAATITWTTNENSDSQVEYGLTTSYGSSSALNSSMLTSHSVGLSGLSAGTLYHYRVKSKDASANLATSADSTFTTQSAPDTTAPVLNITSPAAGSVSGTISFSAAASDPATAGQVVSGLFSISLLIDGSVVASSTSGTVFKSLDTSAMTNGSHTLTASARDNAGNINNAPAISITVFNLSNAPRYPRKIALSGLEGLASVPTGITTTISIVSPTTGNTLDTLSLSPDASKNYNVDFLSTYPQVINIRVKTGGYLSQLLTSIDSTLNSASVISVAPLYAGDFNNDNTINALDYSVMNSHWNQNFLSADINQDGLINSLDFAVLKNNYNRVGQ